MSLPNQRKSKSLALKTINERLEVHDSSDEDVVDKDVAYLVKNFRMEKNPNLHKVSLVLKATGMNTLRKNVRII